MLTVSLSACSSPMSARMRNRLQVYSKRSGKPVRLENAFFHALPVEMSTVRKPLRVSTRAPWSTSHDFRVSAACGVSRSSAAALADRRRPMPRGDSSTGVYRHEFLPDAGNAGEKGLPWFPPRIRRDEYWCSRKAWRRVQCKGNGGSLRMFPTFIYGSAEKENFTESRFLAPYGGFPDK